MSLEQGVVRLHPVKQERYLYREAVLHRDLSFAQNTCKAWKTCGTMRSATITTQVSSRAQAKSTQPSWTCFMQARSFLARRICRLATGTCHRGCRRLPHSHRNGESGQKSHHV